jgi:hypothetical protein
MSVVALIISMHRCYVSLSLYWRVESIDMWLQSHYFIFWLDRCSTCLWRLLALSVSFFLLSSLSHFLMLYCFLSLSLSLFFSFYYFGYFLFLSFFSLIVVLGGCTLQHLQRFLQCIRKSLSCYVAQHILEFIILLLLPKECWDCRHVTPCPADCCFWVLFLLLLLLLLLLLFKEEKGCRPILWSYGRKA